MFFTNKYVTWRNEANDKKNIYLYFSQTGRSFKYTRPMLQNLHVIHKRVSHLE